MEDNKINSLLDSYKYLDDKYNSISVTGRGRLPRRRIEYNKIVGNLLEEIVFLLIESIGYYDDVKRTKLEGNGFDVIAFKDGKLKLAVETTNLAPKSYWCKKKIERTRNNITKSNAETCIILTSFLKSVDVENFNDLDVEFIEVGYQILPIPFYRFTKQLNRDEGTRPLSLERSHQIQQILYNFFIKNTVKRVVSSLHKNINTDTILDNVIDINKRNVRNTEFIEYAQEEEDEEEEDYISLFNGVDPEEDEVI